MYFRTLWDLTFQRRPGHYLMATEVRLVMIICEDTLVHKSRCTHIHEAPRRQTRVTLPRAMPGDREHRMRAARRGMQQTSTGRPATDLRTPHTDIRATAASPSSGVPIFLSRGCAPETGIRTLCENGLLLLHSGICFLAFYIALMVL